MRDQGDDMEEIHDGYRHHVVGAIHEIIMTDDEPSRLRRALEHELEDCNAGRIVIDLTQLDGVTVEHVAAIDELTGHERSMVRLEKGANPVPIGDLERPR